LLKRLAKFFVDLLDRYLLTDRLGTKYFRQKPIIPEGSPGQSTSSFSQQFIAYPFGGILHVVLDLFLTEQDHVIDPGYLNANDADQRKTD
jgi:hypothetical protein